jgi:hypothetical protein
MALSTDDLAYVRDAIGDDGASELLSDTVLNAIYDSATQGDSEVDRTIVFALRRLLGKASRDFAVSDGQGNTEQRQQWFEHLRDTLLPYWEGVVGLTGGQSRGASATNTYRPDSRQTEEPDYSNGISG